MLRRLLVQSAAVVRMASSTPVGGKLAAAGITKDPKDVTEDEWRKILSPEEFAVARKSGTEAPFSGKYDKFLKPGEYQCVCCGTNLFVSDTKFDSGCGWPAFWAAEKAAGSAEKDGSNVRRIEDNSHGMLRVEVELEVRCRVCDGHLGHVFEDGPVSKGGERFCINSAAIHFAPKK